MVPVSISCPTCARPVATAPEVRPASFPFCSPRCRIRDLGAWADGKYVIPGRSPLDRPQGTDDEAGGVQP